MDNKTNKMENKIKIIITMKISKTNIWKLLSHKTIKKVEKRVMRMDPWLWKLEIIIKIYKMGIYTKVKKKINNKTKE